MKLIKFFIAFFLLIIAFSSLSLSQFGKNKVQYEKFEWKYIQSAHFEVYYNAGSKDLAEFSAKSLERALADIEELLKFQLTKRVTVVVYDSHNEFQQTNVIMSYMPEGVGGVTELYKNRVVVPFQGDWSKLDHVIRHELIHAVLNDMFYGGTLQTAISTGGGFQIPLWMNEGLAEFSSLNGMNTETDMYMRDLSVSERVPELLEMNGYLAYRGGQTFYWYVANKYGKEKVGDLINKLKVYRNTDRAFESAFNMDVEEFSEEWQREMKKIYWPDLELFESPKDFAIQITDHEKEESFYNSSPAISPDGESMAYISAAGGIFAIYIKKLEKNAEPRRIVNSNRQQDFEDLNLLTPGISWNPQGTKLAISAKSGGEDAVFIVDVQTEDYEKLKWGLKSISSVVWSPDGSRLAFTATKNNQSDLFIYDFDSKSLENITNDIFSDLNPVWGHDENSLFFISDRSSYDSFSKTFNNFDIFEHDVYQADLYKMNISEKSVERLTFDPEFRKTSLAVGPNDNILLYTSDRNGIYNVYKLEIDTRENVPLTNSINGITQLSLSNDASKLIFTTQINGGYDIYMLRYPFDIDLGIDDLPLTKFRKSQMERKVITENIKAKSKNRSQDEEAELTKYGEFELDVERQEVVEPNEEARTTENVDGKRLINGKEEQALVNEKGEFIEKDYKVNFSTDLIAGNPGFSTYYGVQGVTQMLFSDELGDHQIFVQANIFRDLRNSQLFLSYNYLPNIIDYQFTAYNRNAYVRLLDEGIGEDDLDPESENLYYSFRNIGGGVFGSYAFSTFRRLDFGLNLMYLVKDPVFHREPVDDVFLPIPMVKYTFDNTMWGFYGPRDGSRYYIEAKATPKYNDNAVGFLTFEGDYRHYIPISRFFGFALRGTSGMSFGPDPQDFYLGGTENWINTKFVNNDRRLPFKDPEDFAYMTFVMPLRGWSLAEKYGNKYFTANAEFRFPLLTAFLAGPIPIFQYMMGSFFYDVGGAWTNDFVGFRKKENGDITYNDLLMSTGIGIRSYAFGLPLKLDIAWRNEIDAWSPPEYLISLGLDF